MKTPTSIQFWADKISVGEKYSMARYGDGELLCMKGRSGKNSNGCNYTPELRESLLSSMLKRDGFYHGMQRVLPHDEMIMEREWPEINWHETECFSEAVAKGELYPFINSVRSKKVMIIGNFSIRDATKEIFPNRWFYEVPPANAFDNREDVIEAVLWNNRFNKGWVYLFSCGMAANAFISELHGKIDGWLIDVGHIWDPFAGSMSRCDLTDEKIINKNLEANN